MHALFAAFMLAVRLAGVVIIYITSFAGAAVTDHRFAAVAAKQFGGQQEVCITLGGWGVFVFGQHSLTPLK